MKNKALAVPLACGIIIAALIIGFAGCKCKETVHEPTQIGHFKPVPQPGPSDGTASEDAAKSFMERARVFAETKQYEEALGQVDQLLAIDPVHNEGRILKGQLENTIHYRAQLELQKRKDRQELELLLKSVEKNTSYHGEINYPENWLELTARRKSQPGPSDGTTYYKSDSRLTQEESSIKGVKVDDTYSPAGGRIPLLGNLPLVGGLFRAEGPVDGRINADMVHVTADEVWVIARSETAVVRDDDTPGCGAMMVKLPQKKEKVPLPLKHTDVKCQISGYIATVNVVQQFHNPYDEKIEAVYVFPLPQNAAINEFIMIIGKRKIRGIIRERAEAERIYNQARSQGYTASLLTQERPNIFTQKVANIEPGKDIDVDIKYFNTLAYVDGWYEFVFPMVVGPRFNPSGFTDGVGAVGRGKSGISGQKTEVQYLAPNERSGHDISLSVDIDAGVKIEKLLCPSHVTKKTSDAPGRATVKLSSRDSIPNKDFVLRYKVAGSRLKSALVTHKDKRGGYFSLMLYPPASLSDVNRSPMEMIFVLDCSGSMSGEPIAKAKDAIIRALKKLGPDDTFQIIRFSNNASQLGPKPLPATAKNVRKGLDYVESLRGSGGTQMIEGIKAALDFEHDPRRFRLVSFMTDGYIGNEAQILQAVHDRLGESRIFSFGVGSSVNRYLLDRMAKLGKGAVAYLALDDSAGEIVDLFYDRISHPALTDVEIDFGDMEVVDMYPQQIPDLFVGRPIIVTGRFKGKTDGTISVRGKVGDRSCQIKIASGTDDSMGAHEGIAFVWARKKIEQLASRTTHDNDSDLPGEIKQVALEYGLMSAYTAFVAVDSSRRTEGAHGVTIVVPVPVPDGVKYETTVQN